MLKKIKQDFHKTSKY